MKNGSHTKFYRAPARGGQARKMIAREKFVLLRQVIKGGLYD